jgi:ABC-type transporter Mla subunit MlaD
MRTIFTIVLLLLIGLAGCIRPRHNEYDFALPSAAGLKERAPITFKGIQVGYITNLRLASGEAGPVVATGHITDANMRLFKGDTARVITVGLFADPQIEILRASDSGPELPAGSTVVATSLPSAISVFADLLDIVAEVRRLPPDKQKQVAQQIRAIIDEAKDGSSTGMEAEP